MCLHPLTVCRFPERDQARCSLISADRSVSVAAGTMLSLCMFNVHTFVCVCVCVVCVCVCVCVCVHASICVCIYSGENKYLNPCRFRKFGQLQRNEIGRASCRER